MNLSQLLFVASIVGSLGFLIIILYVVTRYILRRIAEWRELKALTMKCRRLEEKLDEERRESVMFRQHFEEKLEALAQELASLKTKRKGLSIAKGHTDKADYSKSIKSSSK